MRPNSRILFLLSLVCGVTGGGLLYFHNAARDQLLSDPVEVTLVIRALPQGGLVSEDILAPQRLPRKFIPKGAVPFGERGKLLGRPARLALPSGQIIFWNEIDLPGAESGVAGKLEKGERAITIHVDKSSGLENMLKAGHRVDVLATFTGSQSTGRLTRTLLQNISVLAVGAGENGGSYATVTLRVDPSQAELLTFTESAAALRLVLRGASDSDILPRLPEVDFQDILDRPKSSGPSSLSKPKLIYN